MTKLRVEIESLTWNHIPSVHRIFVLDEAKAIHQLDLCNFAGMGGEVVLDIGLCSCFE